MSKRVIIDEFITSKKIAIAGVSRNPKKFGHLLYCTLKDKGYEVYPVNPNADSIDGCLCYQKIADLPDDVKNLLVTTARKDTDIVVKEAIDKGFKNIWLQSGCETSDSIRIANENHVNLVFGCCILMYAQPTGFHKFHQVLSRWFGKYEN
jgi:predicted CoA-binding protein